ncbi:ATP-binding protein [Melioribacter sp. OK-6-Me]|uniref:DNA polymerase III subunit n=1 Tax=unclassified Melioribacter TaxID=2627329 RepID=UPI003ED85ED9
MKNINPDNMWEDVYEQTRAKEILTRFIKSRRVPHALIFYGSEGVGKFNTAINFAKSIYKEITSDGHHLEKIDKLREPYIKLITPLPRGKGETPEDSPTSKLTQNQIENLQSEIEKLIENPYHKLNIDDANTIKINSIREIKKFISVDYHDIPYRFIFILDAHLMNEQAQNALLKSLEEPPEGLVFILITSNIDLLLPTIQSRCWQIKFQPLSEKSVVEILKSKFDIEDDNARRAAHFSGGSIHTALKLIEYDIEFLLETVISILRYSIARKFYTTTEYINKIVSSKNVEELTLIISLIKVWLNDLIRNRYSYNDYYYEEFRDTLIKFNEKFPEAQVEKVFENLTEYEKGLSRNSNLNVITLNLIFELASLSMRN